MKDKKVTEKNENPTVEVVDIQFRPGQKVYYFAANGVTCNPGDHVILDTSRGLEFAYCTGGNHLISQKEVVSPLRPVVRIANAKDEKIAQENREKEEKAFAVCLDMIREQNLDMQLVSAECAFDGSKLLFFFTADDRVDFRELVKNLAAVFHTRIELRQIGVRDKAKMVGGLGICGRPFCCGSFLDDFQPVSIKMAKTQNLSLNPTKISGTCGRLMCCLKYEQDAYEDLIKSSPKLESFVDTPEGRGTVVELDLLRQRVKVRMERQPESVQVFANDSIAVLRSGKAKKTDPPIPEDLAPISGGKKREKRDLPEGRMFLDPIKFRYSEEAIVEEPQEPEAPAHEEKEQSPEQKRNRRRNRRGGKKPEAAQEPKEQKPAQPKAEKPAQPKAEKHEKSQQTGETAGEASKKRRRFHHHRRKGKAEKINNG